MTNIEPLIDETVISEKVVEELIKFGYKTIQDVENDLNCYIDVFREKVLILGGLRDLVIIKDCEKYFRKVYSRDWWATDEDSVAFWKKKGADKIEEYLYNYKIAIRK